MTRHSVINNTRMGLDISLFKFKSFDQFNPPKLPQILDIRDLKHDDAFSTTWPPILSIDKCCQVTSLSIERADHHVLLKASSCLRCLFTQLWHYRTLCFQNID